MLKRLIEVALPLKEVSEQSAREKSIRHGHISTLHIWWARRPLAACRAVVFASLIPDPDDPECPQDFRDLVMELLKQERFRPDAAIDYTTDAAYGKRRERRFEDTPRNRCLEFIKHLVKWENSNNPEFIEPARKLIAAAHKFLHPGAEGDAPKVLDPFAGGGAIPLVRATGPFWIILSNSARRPGPPGGTRDSGHTGLLPGTRPTLITKRGSAGRTMIRRPTRIYSSGVRRRVQV